MFSLLLINSKSSIVTYTSAVQLKGRYTKNRLGVFVQKNQYNNDPPLVYSSRPPYDSGWMWTIEPDEYNASLPRTPVKCDSIITLASATNDLYLSAKQKNGKVYAAAVTHKQELADQWIVRCRDNDIWVQDQEILLQNFKFKCYLSSSLSQRIPDQENKFAVDCRELSSDAVWRATEGIYFPPHEEEKPEENEDQNYKSEL